MTVLDVLHLPYKERVVFERNTLVACICQTQFSPILDIADRASVAPFQRAIRNLYPDLQEGNSVTIEFQPDGGLQQRQGQPQWSFSDISKRWNVVLRQDFLALEVRQYEQFEEFVDRLRFLLVAFCEQFAPVIGKRIGLRYVNEVRVPSGSPTQAINSVLLGPLTAENIREQARQAIQQIVLDMLDDQTLTINHGLIPQGSAVQPKEGEERTPLSEPFYLLDFDIALVSGSSGALVSPIRPDDVCERVGQYNKLMYQLYRWCVTDEFARSLGERQNGS